MVLTSASKSMSSRDRVLRRLSRALKRDGLRPPADPGARAGGRGEGSTLRFARRNPLPLGGPLRDNPWHMPPPKKKPKPPSPKAAARPARRAPTPLSAAAPARAVRRNPPVSSRPHASGARPMSGNLLYYGDNLKWLQNLEAFPSESVDLVYLDPPFKSDQDYNVLFKEHTGELSVAQIKAFEDTWVWGTEAQAAYEEVVEGGGDVSRAMEAFRSFLKTSDMMAYLAMMAPRLLELRRVLKPTGTIYLHCDSSAAHYLKMLMDSVFTPVRFLNEIIWKRTHSHGNVGRNFGSITDTLLVYTKSDAYTWNQQYTQFSEEYVDEVFKGRDPDGRRWQSVTLRNPGKRPNLHYPYPASNGVTYLPHPNGWSCDIDRMRKYDREGRLQFPAKPDGALRLKMYHDESPGIKLQNLWDDIAPVGSRATERLGYPTQKPVALLERIILTSSNEGDTVLDPFCGCGTTIAAAQKLKRRWIGVDVTALAIGLIRRRIRETFGPRVVPTVLGAPESVDDARVLFESQPNGPMQFQWWVLDRVDASARDRTVGADHGIDGRIIFHDDEPGVRAKQIIVSVKGGGTGVGDVRDLVGTMQREKADIGALISLQEPTGPMKREAASAGSYEAPFSKKKYQRVQLLTVEEILAGKRIEFPDADVRTFKQAKPMPVETSLLPGMGAPVATDDPEVMTDNEDD